MRFFPFPACRSPESLLHEHAHDLVLHEIRAVLLADSVIRTEKTSGPRDRENAAPKAS
jgi:hypothetical protein